MEVGAFVWVRDPARVWAPATVSALHAAPPAAAAGSGSSSSSSISGGEVVRLRVRMVADGSVRDVETRTEGATAAGGGGLVDVKLCDEADAVGGGSAARVEDLISLVHLHEPGILHVLTERCVCCTCSKWRGIAGISFLLGCCWSVFEGTLSPLTRPVLPLPHLPHCR